ncbi:MAG: hypothetical protein C4318_04345 [Acidimicrobiia bacterium]
MPLVHQAVASFVPYDAVSEAALRFERILDGKAGARFSGRSTFVSSREDSRRFRPGKIVAEGIHRCLASKAIHFEDLELSRPEDVIIYHVSTDSEIVPWLETRKEKVVVYYHNLTPSLFFAPYDPAVARRLDRARSQLQFLSDIAVAAAAPSEFSCRELSQLGFRKIARVLYPVPPLSKPVESPRRLSARIGSPREPLEILFVGRITPNKAQDQLLRLTALLEREGVVCNLALAGGVHIPLYRRYLAHLFERLDLGKDPFLGLLSPRQLDRRYGDATLFVSFSRHEGFLVPAVEAMQRGLPIIALMRGAVLETVGSGGVLVAEDDVAVFAALIMEIIQTRDLYEQLSWAGMNRARQVCDPEAISASFREFLAWSIEI